MTIDVYNLGDRFRRDQSRSLDSRGRIAMSCGEKLLNMQGGSQGELVF